MSKKVTAKRPNSANNVSHAKNVTITGKGTINGNGQPWWELKKAKKERGQSVPEETYEKILAAMNPGYENQPGGGGGRIFFLRKRYC